MTATASPVTKVGSNYEFVVTHDAQPLTFTVAGAIINGAGVDAPFSTEANFPVGYRIDDDGGETWSATVVDATHIKFTAPA